MRSHLAKSIDCYNFYKRFNNGWSENDDNKDNGNGDGYGGIVIVVVVVVAIVVIIVVRCLANHSSLKCFTNCFKVAEKRKRSLTPTRSPTRRKSCESLRQISEPLSPTQRDSDISISSPPPQIAQYSRSRSPTPPSSSNEPSTLSLRTSTHDTTKDTKRIEIDGRTPKTATTTVPANTPQEHLRIPTGATGFSGFPALHGMSNLMVPSAAAAAVAAAPFLHWSPVLLPPWSHSLLPAAFYPAALRNALPG
uniref:Uncharacterized protein n=1 Tax=Glossina brevipalpis TaxID=37001 RepID=A0A1A9W629_9MUSC